MAVVKIGRRTVKAMIISGVVFSTLITGTFAGATFYGKHISEFLLRDIFRTQAKIGAVSLDFHSHFPETQIYLKDVSLKSTDSLFKPEIIHIGKAKVSLDIYKVLYNRFFTDHRRIEIRSIEADSVRGFLAEDEFGRRNFGNFLGSKPGKRRLPPPEKIEIKNLNLKRIQFRYDCKYIKNKEYYFNIDSIRSNIQVFPEDIKILAQVSGKTEYLKLSKVRILENYSLKANAFLTYHKNNKILTFENPTQITLGTTDIRLSGSMGTGKEKIYDLHFGTPYGNVETLLGLLPTNTGKQLAKFKTSGIITFDGGITGIQTDSQDPHFELNFGCSQASLANLRTSGSISNLEFRGSYTNGTDNSVATTQFKLDYIRGKLAERPFNASFYLRDLINPYIDLELKSKFFFPEMMRLIGISVNDSAKGEAIIDISARGFLWNLVDLDKADSLQFKGKVELQNVNLAVEDQPLSFQDLNGIFSLEGTELKVEKLRGAFNGDVFYCDAQINNLVGFLLKKNRNVNVDLAVNLGVFNLSQFLIDFDQYEQLKLPIKFNKVEKVKQKVPVRLDQLVLKLPDFIDLKLRLNLEKFQYEGLVFPNVKIEAELKDQKLKLDNFKFINSSDWLDVVAEFDATGDRIPFKIGVHFASKHLTELFERLKLIKPNLHDSLKTKHEVNFVLSIVGEYTNPMPGTRSKLNASISFSEGSYLQRKSKIKVQDFQFVTHIDERWLTDYKRAPILLDSITGRANNYRFNARVGLDNITDQNIQAKISSSIALPVFLQYFSIPSIADPEGFLEFETGASGKLVYFMHPDSFRKIVTSGFLNIQNFGCRLVGNNLPVKNIDLSVDYDSSGIYLNRFSGKVGSTHLKGKGILKDVISYFYGKTTTLRGDLNFSADTIHIREFLSKDITRKERDDFKLNIPDLLRIKGDLQINHLKYDQLNFDAIRLNTSVVERTLHLNELRFKSCGGNIFASAKIQSLPNDSLEILAHLSMDNVEVNQAMKSLNNFKQQKLTDKNVSGNFDAQISISDRLASNLDSRSENLEINMNFRLEEGNLKDFKPLAYLSPFIKKRYTQDVKFALQARNIFYIRNTLHLSTLELKSNIFDINVFGIQKGIKSFDYHIRVGRVGHRERLESPSLLAIRKRSYQESILAFNLLSKKNKLKVRYDWNAARMTLWAKVMFVVFGQKIQR